MEFLKSNRYKAAIAAFDALNEADPNRIEQGGQMVGKELHDALAMTRWVETLYPNASEAVYLAARCQHICRWEIPRSRYPEGRAAYHQWRNALKVHHARRSREILEQCGYDEALIVSVEGINQKRELKYNVDVQQIEDALCLVFLESQYELYLKKWDDVKMIRILQKTWAKMSETGRSAALGLSYSDGARRILQEALGA